MGRIVRGQEIGVYLEAALQPNGRLPRCRRAPMNGPRGLGPPPCAERPAKVGRRRRRRGLERAQETSDEVTHLPFDALCQWGSTLIVPGVEARASSPLESAPASRGRPGGANPPPSRPPVSPGPRGAPRRARPARAHTSPGPARIIIIIIIEHHCLAPVCARRVLPERRPVVQSNCNFIRRAARASG